MRGFWLGTAALIFVAGTAMAQGSLQYSSGVSAEQKLRLQKDLIILGQTSFVDADGELKRVYKLPVVNELEMQKWLAVRAHFIIDEKHPFDMTVLRFLKENVLYPFSNEHSFASVLKTQATQAEQEPQIVMSNLGAAVYGYAKQSHALIGFAIQGVGTVAMTSPRVGIFKVGAGLFQPLSANWGPEVIEDRLHTYFRLSTLFHESRHSDGHGKTLAFTHPICPKGHDYDGFPACDSMANGSYRIETLFLKSVSDGCSDCARGEKDALAVLQADAESRIVEKKLEWNDSPEVLKNP